MAVGENANARSDGIAPSTVELMIHLLPIATISVVLALSLPLLRERDGLATHFPFAMFLVLQVLFGIRAAIFAGNDIDYSSRYLLSDNEYVLTTIEYALLLLATTVVYRATFALLRPGSPQEVVAAPAMFQSSAHETVVLFVVGVGAAMLALYVRIRVLGERFDLSFQPDLETRLQGRGGSFVPALLGQVSQVAILLAIELRVRAVVVISILCALAAASLASGSKAGFLLPLIAAVAYATIRRRLPVRTATIVLVSAAAVASVVVGTLIRLQLEGTVDQIEAGGLFGLIVTAIVARFDAFDATQILLARPDMHSGLIARYWQFIIASPVPISIWPDKPANPCFELSQRLASSVLSCAAPGWIGGAILLFGAAGALLAPILVGTTLASLAHLVSRPRQTSLVSALGFFVAFNLMLAFIEGTYYQAPVLLGPGLLSFIFLFPFLVRRGIYSPAD